MAAIDTNKWTYKEIVYLRKEMFYSLIYMSLFVFKGIEFHFQDIKNNLTVDTKFTKCSTPVAVIVRMEITFLQWVALTEHHTF